MQALNSALSRFFLSLPQNEMEQRARLLNRITRLLVLAAIGWGLAPSFIAHFISTDPGVKALILAVVALTAVSTCYCQARSAYQAASVAFIIGFTLTVSIAVWKFGRDVPEVHLLYFLPIALAATLWGSVPGTIIAVAVWFSNVSAVTLQSGSFVLPQDLNGMIGLFTLSVAYIVVAQVVGRYAQNLIQALGRAEQKAKEAEKAERQTRVYADELENAYVQTVFALAKAVEAKDTYTSGHSDRLAILAERVARKLGIRDETKLKALRFGAMLHDVGKIGIPDSILKKPGRLDEKEWVQMRQHPVIGSRILEPVARLQDAAKIVLHHHERWDGNGYPDRLIGEDIPFEARILTVVDAFTAIIDQRVYKPARSVSEAISELKRASGTQFDPRTVEAFLLVIEEDEGGLTRLPPAEIAVPSSSQIFQELVARASVQQLQALSRLTATLSSSFELTVVLEQAAQTVVEILGAAAAGIFLLDGKTDHLSLAAHSGLPDQLLSRFSAFPVNGFHNELVVRENRERLHGSPEDIPEFVRLGLPSLKPEWGNYLCVPLNANDEVKGVMGIFSYGVRSFEPYEVTLYKWLGEQIGIAISNAQRHEAIRMQALTDNLTGAYNRRYLNEFLSSELKRGYHRGISIILLDIDSFKDYNDTHGHLEGDQALQEMTSVIQNNLRASDVLVRYGGDEFVIALPGTLTQGTVIVAEKIRAEIERHEFPCGKLRISLGMASCDRMASQTLEDLLAMADRALYEAKRNGRNRVAICEATPLENSRFILEGDLWRE